MKTVGGRFCRLCVCLEHTPHCSQIAHSRQQCRMVLQAVHVHLTQATQQPQCSEVKIEECRMQLCPMSAEPPREQCVCRHCSMQAVEDEQHFLFDCPFYSIIRGQHFSLFGPSYQQRVIRLFFEQKTHQLGFFAHHIHLCFQARMSDESLLAPHPRL